MSSHLLLFLIHLHRPFPAPSRSAMAPIKVHGSVISPPSQRVLLALYEKELEFEFVPVDIRSVAHKQPTFLAMNPFGQVPVLEDSGFSLFESRAITQYLAQTYKDQGTDLVFPGDKQGIAELAVWMQVESQQFDQPAYKILIELLFKSMFGMGAPNADVVAENEAKLGKVLDVYEGRLGRSKYLSGAAFGLADLHHVPALNVLLATPVKKLLEERPHVWKWVEDVLARPSWAKVLALQKA